MSEKSKIQCPVCGAELPVNESKGFKHGMAEILKRLLATDEVEPSISQGEEQTDDLQNVSITQAKKSVGERIKAVFSYKVINRIVVLLLAICMLALAFAPLVSTTVQAEDGTEYTVSLSGLDGAKMTVVSAVLLTEKNLYESDLYEKLFATPEQEMTPEDTLKQGMLLSAIDGKVGLNGSPIAALLIFVTYAILCLVLVIVAIKNLISELIAYKKKRFRAKRYGADGLLCMLFCLLPVLCFLFMNMCEFCTRNSALGRLMIVDFGLAWGAVVSFVVALLGSAFVCIAGSVALLRSNRLYFNGIRLRSIICSALIIFIMIATLLPCLKINVWNENAEVDKAMQVNLMTFGEMSSQDRKQYRVIPVEESLRAQLAAEEESKGAGESFVNTLLMGSNVSTIRVLYGAVMAVTGLFFLFAGLLLWALLRKSFFDSKRTKMISAFKVFTMICVTADLILAVALKSICEMSLKGDLSSFIEFKLGTGVILMFVCMIVMLAIRLKAKKKKVTYMDEDYDNADVSYAPYVLDAED